MDTILEHIMRSNEIQIEVDDFYDEKVSLWVNDKDRIIPSTNIMLLKKLEPGVYEVDYSNDQGYYCKKTKPINDELFIFSNSITQNLLKEIDLFWSKKELYKQKNYLHKRGILLMGFPGTGKTSLITQISEGIINSGGIVFSIRDPKNLTVYISFVVNAIREIEPETPIITIIEDIDKYGQVETELLDFLDGKTNINHHIVIATSNNTEDLPEALLRTSRFDIKIELPLPDEKTREEYFRYKEVEEEDIKSLVSLTKDLSLSDLKEIYICTHFLDYTIEEAVTKVKNPEEGKNYNFKFSGTHRIGF